MDIFFLIIWYLIPVIFALGYGSFATMAVYRIPNGQAWFGKKPFCPNCLHDLKFLDYISLISVFLFKGKCRYCKAKYGYKNIYFVTELLIFIYLMINFLLYGFSDIYLLNSAIIICAVIWLIIYFNEQKNISIFLTCMFFFAVIRDVLINNDIFNSLFAIILFVLYGVFARALIFLFRDKKQCFDFMRYSDKGKFSAESFLFVKILAITGAIIGLGNLSLWLFLLPFLCLLIFKKLRYSLTILINFNIILLFLHHA